MKKSMTRLLSLALVLVMLVGIVPAALAAEGDGSLTISTSDGKKEYMLKEDGSEVTVSVGATVTAPTGYKLTSYHWTVDSVAKETVTAESIAPVEVKATGKEEKTVKVSLSATFTQQKPADAGDDFTADTKEVKATELSVKFVPYQAPTAPATEVTVTLSKSEGTAVVGQTDEKLTVKVTDKDGKEIALKDNFNVTWADEDKGFVSVTDDGTVSFVKAGTEKVTATVVPVDAEKYVIKTPADGKASCTYTVKDKLLVVEVKGGGTTEKTGSTITLTAALKGDEELLKGVDKTSIKYTFEIDDKHATATADGSTLKVSSKDGGVVGVTVTAEYKIGDKTFTTEPVTTYVSFYDSVNIDVESGKSNFKFGDKNVFTKAVVNGGKPFEKPMDVTLASLILNKAPEGASFKLDTDGHTTLTYENQKNQHTVKKVPENGLENVILNAAGSKNNDYRVTYEVSVKAGEDMLVVQKGTIDLLCVTGGNIEYKTDKKTAITFDEDDFMNFWYKEKNDRKLDYVMFQANGDGKMVNYGELNESNDKKADKVDEKTKYYFDARSSEDDLDTIVYIPSEDVTTTYYEVVIPFTAYGEKGDTLGGMVVITVEDGGDIVYKTTYTKNVILDEDDFRAYYNKEKKNKDSDFAYVTFDSDKTGDPKQGALFVDNTDSADFVDRDMRFHYRYNKNDNNAKNDYDLDAVTYVPDNRADKAYVDYVAFTAHGEKGEEIRGVVAFEVGKEMPFKDVKENDWFYGDVEYVYSNGIMNGTGDTTFAPQSPLTRAMVVTMLWRIEKEPAARTSDTFKDVEKNEWYTKAVEWAADEGIVKGYSATTFGPMNNITRQDLAVILYRYTEYKNGKAPYSNTSLTKFTDYKTVAEYAEDALEWAVYEGIMKGDAGRLNPTGNATRAEAAAMFHRFLEKK